MLNCPACKQPTVHSKAKTFDELAIDACFIVFPSDGDDSGHGGFRGRYRLFRKTHGTTQNALPNSIAVGTGAPSHWPDHVRVLEILP